MFKTLSTLALLLVAAPFAHAGGACSNSADSAIVSNASAVDSVAVSCGVQCVLSGTPASCISSCMSSKAGLSKGCADCFGADGVCTKNHCALQCISPQSASCIACSKQFCLTEFRSCAGVNSVKFASLASCSSADDAKLVNKASVTANLKKCGAQCKADSNCMASCMESATGVSATCGSCFKAFSTCTASNCLIQCIADPSSASCQTCATQHCEPALDACTGLASLAPLVAGSKCSSADDAKLVNKATVTANLKTCGAQCKADSNCMATCMESKTGVSSTCGSCFKAFSSCTASNCLIQCIADPSSASCQACATQHCEPALDSCTGLAAVTANVAGSQCSSADDAKLVNKATVTANLKTCGAQCKADSNCMATCMESKTGVSSTCGSCFKAFSSCTASNCLFQCIADPSSASCQACATQHCEPALDSCTGLAAALTSNVATSSQCSAADATKLVNRATVTANLKVCGTQCKADSSCMATCMETKTGISSTCGSCFSSFSSCTASSCLFQCIADPSSATCQACATQHCEPALDKCIGYSPSTIILQ